MYIHIYNNLYMNILYIYIKYYILRELNYLSNLKLKLERKIRMSDKLESLLELKESLRRNIFSALKIKPNQEFGLKSLTNKQYPHIYQLNNNLALLEDGRLLGREGDELLLNILRGIVVITDLVVKRSLNNLTDDEYDNWLLEHCEHEPLCENCIFRHVNCANSLDDDSWINNKELFSQIFLEQEIEI